MLVRDVPKGASFPLAWCQGTLRGPFSPRTKEIPSQINQPLSAQ